MQEIGGSVWAATADQVQGIVEGGKRKGEEKEEKMYGRGRKK